jgi:IS30 family transposase
VAVSISNSQLSLEERRRQVAHLLARAKTETEIAQSLGVSQQTISRDIQALKEASLQFVYDLAKSDLAYYYKQKLNGLDEVIGEAWKMYGSTVTNRKEKLMALKIIVMAHETSFKLLNEGPAILAMKAMDDRLSALENVPDQEQ